MTIFNPSLRGAYQIPIEDIVIKTDSGYILCFYLFNYSCVVKEKAFLQLKTTPLFCVIIIKCQFNFCDEDEMTMWNLLKTVIIVAILWFFFSHVAIQFILQRKTRSSYARRYRRNVSIILFHHEGLLQPQCKMYLGGGFSLCVCVCVTTAIIGSTTQVYLSLDWHLLELHTLTPHPHGLYNNWFANYYKISNKGETWS